MLAHFLSYRKKKFIHGWYGSFCIESNVNHWIYLPKLLLTWPTTFRPQKRFLLCISFIGLLALYMDLLLILRSINSYVKYVYMLASQCFTCLSLGPVIWSFIPFPFMHLTLVKISLTFKVLIVAFARKEIY